MNEQERAEWLARAVDNLIQRREAAEPPEDLDDGDLDGIMRVARARLALADLLYDKDDLAGAMVHLEHGRQRTPAGSPQRPYLDLVTARVSRAEKAEEKYSARESSHFLVKFNGNEDYDTWTKVLDILEDAYRDIGQKFSYFPAKPITVVLHTKASFQGATGSPAWADGLYDGVLGRIQIPTQGALTDPAWLARVLRHEFVHALLHQRVEGGHIPQWLNEGLAMQLAGDNSWPDLDRVIRGEVTLIALNRLEGGWAGFPSDLATVARHHFPFVPSFFLRDRFTPVHDLAGFRRPAVVLVAGRDEVVTAAEGRRLFSALPGPKKLVEQPEATHNGLDLSPGNVFWTEAVRFLSRED